MRDDLQKIERMEAASVMIKVCIVGVYFGKLPNYFDLWLNSAQENPTIDFIVFTDEKRENLPGNVRFINFTLKEMQQLSSAKLGFNVCMERSRKCCDLKPAYGLIFEDYLKEYDYWGHCDFDLIWGDLRGFFNRYHLENYDKFLPLGHLSLYRNTDENNRRFMLEGADISYKTVFSDPGDFAFDEASGIYQIFEKNGFSMFNKRIFADISLMYSRYRLAFDDKNYDYQVFCWDNGHVFRYYEDGGIKKDEFIYIHFKKRGALPVEEGCLCPGTTFYITNRGFFPCNASIIDRDLIQKYNHFESQKFESIERKRYLRAERKQRIAAKVKKLFRNHVSHS